MAKEEMFVVFVGFSHEVLLDFGMHLTCLDEVLLTFGLDQVTIVL